ncbi:hypothetical protein EVAR_8410_1 [Eumeta japonica]|uniref:Uncharacterized protein n=1 Tax=Eumeta variegata TaxID=151549 RepID=A0A4C1WEA4_EUMVA|nr:hypothetical protein EVAR_8410_1 [Eumeta japonica]
MAKRRAAKCKKRREDIFAIPALFKNGVTRLRGGTSKRNLAQNSGSASIFAKTGLDLREYALSFQAWCAGRAAQLGGALRLIAFVCRQHAAVRVARPGFRQTRNNNTQPDVLIFGNLWKIDVITPNGRALKTWDSEWAATKPGPAVDLFGNDLIKSSFSPMTTRDTDNEPSRYSPRDNRCRFVGNQWEVGPVLLRTCPLSPC